MLANKSSTIADISTANTANDRSINDKC